MLPIIPPKINDPGASVSYQIGGHRVGDVVQVATEPDKDYVVLQDGLQPVTKLTADGRSAACPGSRSRPPPTTATAAGAPNCR
ncbi:type VII secretion protein EccB [Mycobacteroides abscessus subsp. abscessus]|nr:type VII secretion protein EccB [Mycobacteroides abscessus subsp. abscessus]